MDGLWTVDLSMVWNLVVEDEAEEEEEEEEGWSSGGREEGKDIPFVLTCIIRCIAMQYSSIESLPSLSTSERSL